MMSRDSYLNNSSGEVIFADERIIKLSDSDIGSLKNLADVDGRKSVRLCAHGSIEDQLHEMFIVHTNNAYVRPHKHMTKSISFHVVEGLADFVIFDEEGNIIDVIPVGDYSSGRRFYCRVPSSQYYTQLIRSDVFVFHETIIGPFDRSDTVWAPWSPERLNHKEAEKFMNQMVRSVDNFTSVA